MPIRTCLVTGKKCEPSLLKRFTIQEGRLVFDGKKKSPARGGYVENTSEALAKLPKIKGKIAHFLRHKGAMVIEE